MECEAFLPHLYDPFICTICLDTLTEPVTIPCGHSFCMGCIGTHWDDPDRGKNSVSCPLCLEKFSIRPQLRKSHLLSELLERSQTGGQQAAAPKPSSSPEDILCDFCTEEQTEAAKSCLVCMASYCEPHLKPHLKNPVFQSHRLVPPVRHMEEKLCKLHLEPLEGFCRTDQACICLMCAAQMHKEHEVVTLELEKEHREAQQPQLLKDVARKMKETGASIARAQGTVNRIKDAALKEREDVLGVLEKFQKALLGSIESEAQSLLVPAEEVLAVLEEKQKKLSQQRQKLDKVSSTDSVSFIQVFQALKAVAEEGTRYRTLTFDDAQSFTFPREAVRAVNDLMGVRQENREAEARGVSSPRAHEVLEEVTLNSNGQWISKPLLYDQSDHSGNLEFPSYFLPHAHQVVFDADTAERYLVLTGNEVKRQSTPLDYPENDRRFTNCAQVLGQGLASEGHYYWEVEIISGYVSFGLASEQLDPKGPYESSRLGRNNCSCCLRWDGERLASWYNNKETVITHSYHKIGVFVDGTNNEYTITFCGVEPSRIRWLHQLYMWTNGCFYPAFYLESVGGSPENLPSYAGLTQTRTGHKMC